uniref:VGF nerve growth factor inducible n=1 Tax=Oreochromis niloticus TaxID=8128 RepID=A0A669BQQ3_ORENI
MTRYHNPSSALIQLLLLTAASFLHLSTSDPLSTLDKPYQHTSGLTVSGYRNIGGEESQPMQKQEEAEREEELFKNVDPKKLAAVLLEALNNSKAEQMNEGEGRDGMEEEMTTEKEEYKNEDSYRRLRTIEGADRDRDGRQELELLMATQGKEQETGEDEERKKAQKEETLTERVTSRTTSHTVEIAREKPPTGSDGLGDNGQSTGSQQGSTSPDQASSEEEEQLSPEELKSLEMMMKEFPALNVPIKREGDSEQSHRESRDYSYNDIMPINKGSDLAITKKKLKWQEETQKALSIPKFRGDNFMDEFDDSNHNSADLQAPREQTMEDDEPDEEEEDEEVLSPEEEEAQAKGEQEEMRRQAAEAQRAKMEEEMLADIASDMLLRYMVKQNNGNKHYSSSLSSAAEDKRSDEEQEVTEEDDIDPQTIDKLIEISSKLHLPADDVVDIISDVEKKKKKDLSPDVISGWRRPLSPISSPFSSESQISSNQNDIPASNQPFPAVNFLKTWFQKKKPTRSEDLWNKPAKPQLGNQNIWAKPPVPIKQDLWLTSPKSAWTRYPHYPVFPHTYPSYYQKNLDDSFFCITSITLLLR